MTIVTCADCGKTFNAELQDVHPTLFGEIYCAPCWRARHALPEDEGEQIQRERHAD